MNERRLMYKLQTALCASGKRVKIDQRQHWNEKAGRMVTVYEARRENRELVRKSYSAIDIVHALADLIAEDGGGTA